MAEYRYYTRPMFANWSGVIAELPLYGVWCQKLLSAAGQFTGTFKLGTGIHRDDILLDGSMPAKTQLFVERDGTLIWGGIIWSRTWQEQSKTIQISAQTFESVFNKIALPEDFIEQDVDQVQILLDLFTAMEGGTQFTTQIDTTTLPHPMSGVTRTVLIPGYEYHYAQDVLDQLVGVDNGLDFTLEAMDGFFIDEPVITLKTGYPTLGSDYPRAVYDYPGSVNDFVWPESAGDGCLRKVSLGAGSGNQILSSLKEARDQMALYGPGDYPGWWRVDSYSNIADQKTLDDMTQADLNKYLIARSVPSFTIKPDVPGGFTAWNQLGAPFSLHIDSVRFPGGKDIDSRMIGWELSPGDSDTDEQLKIIMEGDSGGV